MPATTNMNRARRSSACGRLFTEASSAPHIAISPAATTHKPRDPGPPGGRRLGHPCVDCWEVVVTVSVAEFGDSPFKTNPELGDHVQLEAGSVLLQLNKTTALKPFTGVTVAM
jgi:hypothetical protein